jgi:hypothetical protein
VFEQVRAFLSAPDLMRAGLRELVASETAEQERDCSELAHWTEALQNVEIKTERLKARRQMVEVAQGDMEALIESYAEAVPRNSMPSHPKNVTRSTGCSDSGSGWTTPRPWRSGAWSAFLKSGNISTADAGRM